MKVKFEVSTCMNMIRTDYSEFVSFKRNDIQCMFRPLLLYIHI